MSISARPKFGDEWYREQAKNRFHDEGYFEIDEHAPVSQAEGNPERGAYVQAWVWIEERSVDGCTSDDDDLEA